MDVRERVDLRQLAERVRAIERRHRATAAHDTLDPPLREFIPTGWTKIDAALGGGLARGELHEWFGVEAPARGAPADPAAPSLRRTWTPPLCILVHLAWQALDPHPAPPWTVWIGKRCHPYPRLLIRGDDRRLLERSLFVAPRDAASRLWAMDLALRSVAVGVVIADGSDFDRAATQRVQLLARSGGKVVLAACPPPQQRELSAAQTRWRVCAAPPVGEKSANGIQPGWSVELLRCKGGQPVPDRRVWLLEWNRAEGAVGLSARLADLAGPPETQVHPAGPARRQRTA